MMRAICPHLSRSFSTHAGSSPSQRCDVTIVGAGIVGLSVARHITIRHPHLSVCVVEKEPQIAMHQSSHNSGVIHAGMYYQPGSVRARLCMSGAQAMYRYCDEHQIPYRRVGKLIVATSHDELERLDIIYQRGLANKVPDICMVESHEISKMEPAVHALRGIWSPHTGIIRFRDVGQSYARAIEQAGHQIITNFTLARVERHSIHPTFTSTSQSVPSAFSSSTDSATSTSTASSSTSSSSFLTLTSTSGHHITTRFIITCCGLYSDRIAYLCGNNRNPTIVPFRGSWLHLKREYVNIVKTNIYPVPNPHFPFLGVHLTPTMDGDMLIGPNAVLAAAREGYSRFDINLSDLCESLAHPGLRRLLVTHPKAGISEIIRDLLPSLAITQVQRMVPSLTLSHVDLNATTTGVRAQALGDDGKLIEDFILQPDSQHRDILHVRNAPSPAATASITIGEHVVKEAATLFGW